MELYRSIGSTILKLPEGNPPLPAGDPSEVEVWNPEEPYLNYRLLGFFLGGIPGILVGIGLLIFGFIALVDPHTIAGANPKKGLTQDLPLVGLGCMLAGLFTLGSMAAQYVILHLELDMLRYTLTDEALRLRRGVVNVEEVTLSFANIQNVKFNQGPVQRYFGIGDLIVDVAGGGGAPVPQQGGAQAMHHQGLIKGVSDPERLRDLIQARVRSFRGSGLGGPVEDQEDDEPEASTALESPEARALLAEIRDALAATRLSA